MLGKPREVGPGGPQLLPHDRPSTVCIVLPSGVGDVVHGLPLAADIKRVNPSCRILWVAQPVPAEVLAHHPHVDRVISYRPKERFGGVPHLWRDMRTVRADLALNARFYFRSIPPTLFSGAPCRVGLPRSRTRDGVFLALTHVLQESPWKHTQDLFLDFRWALGVEREAPLEWRITFSEEERAEQKSFFVSRDSRRRVGLVIGTALGLKNWPPDRYATLASALSTDLNLDVLLLGGPTDRERQASRIVMEQSQPSPTDCLGDGLRRLMWLLDGCDLVVSPDTGPLHIAHALGVPVVGLYGRTNPWRVGPYNRFHDLVIDRYTDPGEEPDPSGYPSKVGRMETISVDDVLAKVELALERYVHSDVDHP